MPRLAPDWPNGRHRNAEVAGMQANSDSAGIGHPSGGYRQR